jgi:hypothetical protein
MLHSYPIEKNDRLHLIFITILEIKNELAMKYRFKIKMLGQLKKFQSVLFVDLNELLEL